MCKTNEKARNALHRSVNGHTTMPILFYTLSPLMLVAYNSSKIYVVFVFLAVNNRTAHREFRVDPSCPIPNKTKKIIQSLLAKNITSSLKRKVLDILWKVVIYCARLRFWIKKRNQIHIHAEVEQRNADLWGEQHFITTYKEFVIQAYRIKFN